MAPADPRVNVFRSLLYRTFLESKSRTENLLHYEEQFDYWVEKLNSPLFADIPGCICEQCIIFDNKLKAAIRLQFEGKMWSQGRAILLIARPEENNISKLIDEITAIIGDLPNESTQLSILFQVKAECIELKSQISQLIINISELIGSFTMQEFSFL